MAKITFAHPLLARYLETSGDNLYRRGLQFFMRVKPIPPKFKTPSQQTTRQLLKTISESWKTLTTLQKAKWTIYHTWFPLTKSPFHLFARNNMQLLTPEIPGVGVFKDITSPPQTPTQPVCLTATYVSFYDGISVEWTDSYQTTTYIEGFQWLMPGRRRAQDLPLNYITYALSSDETFLIPSSKIADGVLSIVALRALNLRGEVSIPSVAVETSIPFAPQADFSATPLWGPTALTTQFTDASSGIIIERQWDFGDGDTSEEVSPEHTYESVDPTYFTPQLTLTGPAGCEVVERKNRYILITSTKFFISDTYNHRIMRRNKDNLSYVAKIGSYGTGDDQFKFPRGMVVDETHLYVCDRDNDRVMKRLRTDLSYVAKIGTWGTGNDQFNLPGDITMDDTHLYICDEVNCRIVKRLKSDLSYVAQVGTEGAGDDQFQNPLGITSDDTYIYVNDTYNCRIVKRLKSDLSYVAQVGTAGSGDNQFNDPTGLTIDETYLYIADTWNNRIMKRLKSDLSYVAQVGTWGTGNDQFKNPYDIAADETYLYVVDTSNYRLMKRLKSDLSYVAKFGSSGVGDDNLGLPMGVSTEGLFQ